MTGRLRRPVPAGGLTPQRRYGLLLMLLLLTYLLSAFTTGAWVSLIQVVLFSVAAIVTLGGTGAQHRHIRLITGFVLGVTVIMAGLALSRVSQIGEGIANIWAALVLLVTVVLIVRNVLTMGAVTLQSIFGAVSAYLILGLMFAACYSAVSHLGGGDFFAGGRAGNTQTFQYFSFTTLTTLGYGDYTAARSGGQALAVIEALSGQVFLATLVARLVASFRSGMREPPPGSGPPRRPSPSGPAPSGPAPSGQARPPRRGRNPGIDPYGTIAARGTTGRASTSRGTEAGGRSGRPGSRSARRSEQR
ncbi:MAG TPA: potassium channel family protein [Streptosporangiaceae bacterium]|jgi:hypothetical protein